MDAFYQITDDGFPGAKSLDFVGQRIVYVEPFGRYWGWSSLVDASSWNSLDQAQAETSPDRIQGLIVSHNEVLIFGERTIEPWAHAPTDTAVFQLQVGSVIESGCAAGRTIQRLDNSVFYLTNNGQIARLNGYTPQVISTAAMEASIRGLNWSRAFAFTWEDAGHVVYYITFPDGHTWGYDVRQGKWHRRASYGLDRWRINALAKSNGKHIAGDYSSGNVYEVEWGNVYEACEIMPRTFRSGVLHNASNPVFVHGFRIVAATGQPPKLPVSVEDVGDRPKILVTGNGVSGDPTPFITAPATEVPVFVGIPTSTGASPNYAACSVNSEGIWIAVGQTATLYSTDIATTWTSVATSFPVSRGRFGVYGPDGWLLQYAASGHLGELASASSIPTDIAAATVNAGSSRTSFSWINYTGGKYYGSVFFNSNVLWSCATIGGTWTVVTTESSALSGGTWDLIRAFYDIVEFEGALYACCYNSTETGGLGGGSVLRRSTDNGATWDDLLVDGRGEPEEDPEIDPFQLCLGNGILIAVNRDVSKVWTSEDGFSTAHTTGVTRTDATLPRNETEGRFVAYTYGRFFIMGDTGVVSTADGITFSEVAAYPSSFNTPISIAAFDDPELQPPPEACTPMEGGFFQLRYSNDGGENWRNWRDAEPPRTGWHLQPIVFRRNGMARHRVWEVMDTSNRPQDVLAAEIILE